MNYTVAEFRKNIREALNAVERGEEVYITRHNKTFAIIKAPFNYLSDDGKSHDIRPDFGVTPVAIKNELAEKNNSEAKASLIEEITGQMAKAEADRKDLETIIMGNSFIEAGSPHADDGGEFPCCKLPKPCKHWQWDGVEQAYVNSLSGRSKAV